MDIEKTAKLVKKVDKAKREMAVVSNMIGQLNERIDELESLIKRIEKLELLPGQLKARFAGIDEKLKDRE